MGGKVSKKNKKRDATYKQAYVSKPALENETTGNIEIV
jgi:hypothetical protein